MGACDFGKYIIFSSYLIDLIFETLYDISEFGCLWYASAKYYVYRTIPCLWVVTCGSCRYKACMR